MRALSYSILTFIVISAFCLSGCASNGFLMGKPKVTMFGNAYPSKNEGANIDVYVTAMPNREYVEIAQIVCVDTNDKWSLEQIQKKAREIGADGIIIIGKTGSSSVGVPTIYSAYVVSEEYGMIAIAIKYK